MAIASPALAYQLLPVEPSKTGTTPTADPLGRDTPSGTLYGFLQAAQAGNYSTAAQYLQMSSARRQTQGEDVATKLKVVIDRCFNGDLRRISNQPDGTPQEGVPLDKQRVGTLTAGDVEADLILVRVPDGNNRIWLISSDTLARLPDLYDQAAVHQVETHLPHALVSNSFLGLPLWQWLAILIAVPIAAGLGWLAVQVLRLPWYLWARYRKHEVAAAWSSFVRPLWLVLGVLAHGVLVSYLRIPVLQRHHYQQVAGVVAVIGFNWLLWRILRAVLKNVRQRAVLAGRMGTGSLMILGERMLKAAIVVAGHFHRDGHARLQPERAARRTGHRRYRHRLRRAKTWRIFSAAFRFWATKSSASETPAASATAWERSWTSACAPPGFALPERTELSIPNGSLATMNVENLSRRDKILFNTKLGLRYETSPDQMRYVLVQVRRLLYEHPKVETEGARSRFVSFDVSALTMEIFCYVLTRDDDEFLAIREDILLRIMDIVDAAGSGFAFPSQTVYLGRDSGIDKQKAETAAQEVQKWRDEHQLPFPDFTPADISEISNSLPYPQPGSAVGKKAADVLAGPTCF